jgi:hypothetical protein
MGKHMYTTLQNYLKKVIKLKALDWVVILVLAVITIYFVATSIQQNKWITVKFIMTLTPQYFHYNGEVPPYWIAGNIKAGDVQYDSFGAKNLQILSVTSIGYQNRQTWVTASVKAKYIPKQKKYVFQYVPLEIGRSIDTTINGTNIHGIVTDIEGYTDARKMYDVTVKARLVDEYSPYSVTTRGIDPWIADAIQKGQTMKDSSGKTVAEILDVETKPAEKVVTTNDGKIFLGEDPLKKDVFLTVKLKAIKHDDSYFFLEDMPLKIGYSFPIYLDQIQIVPVITQIL